MKKLKYIFVLMGAVILLTACGPSEEKIAEAQAKYRELVKNHNQVAKANSDLGEDTLSDELDKMVLKIEEIKAFNLYEMKDEEIDMVIDVMDSMNESYSGYLKTIGEIKLSEEAKVLSPVSFSLLNNTNMTFSKLSIMEKGEKDLVTNVLDMVSGFMPKQRLIGLTVYKDADNTPWIISVTKEKESEDEEEKVINLVIDMDSLKEDADNNLELVFDSEKEEIVLKIL
ncbi:MAG: hypothetical protein MJZ11_07055 [Lachnospiraceae bacterium]|nr:hypothetical protein [Lachnospiraceae bacterium]